MIIVYLITIFFRITMSTYVPQCKKGGVYHPLNIIDISTSDEEVEDVIINIETSE